MANNARLHIATFWRGSLLAAVALVALRQGGLPLWFGWLTAALALGSLVGSISFIDSPIASTMTMVGYGSFIGFQFWVLVAGVVLAVRSASETNVDPRPAADRPGNH